MTYPHTIYSRFLYKSPYKNSLSYWHKTSIKSRIERVKKMTPTLKKITCSVKKDLNFYK